MIENQKAELTDPRSALSLLPWMDKLIDSESDLQKANRLGSGDCCRLQTTKSEHVSDGLRLVFDCSRHDRTVIWLKGWLPSGDGETRQTINTELSAARTTREKESATSEKN